MNNPYQLTKGKKTTSAMVAYLLLRGVGLVWPDLLTVEQTTFAIDAITILGALGITDKLIRLLNGKKRTTHEAAGSGNR